MTRTRHLLALAGVLTGAAGLVTSQATVWLLQANNSALSAVADAIADLLAGGPAMDLGHLVGPVWDRRLLVLGILVFLIGVSAWLGTVVTKRPLVSDLAYFALAAIGFYSVIRLPNSSAASLIGVVVGLITWIAVSRLLTRPMVAESTLASDTVNEATRRAFLMRAGITTGVVAFSGVLGRFSSRRRREVEQARRDLDLPVSQGGIPAGVEVGLRGVGPWRTPNDDFYLIDTAFSRPVIAPKDWKLRIHGMVDRELTITYDDLLRRATTEAWITLSCVSNVVGGDLIGNAYWSGFLIRDILAEAGVKRGATAVKQTSDDGWTCGTPIEALTDERNAMLAVAMNGEPLPIEHGFPVRMVVPGLYGFVSATKWLVDLEVTTFDKFEAFWTTRGWAEEGPVLTQSRIEVPRDGQATDGGQVRIGGTAWAQHTGIAKVEYQIDGGSWQEATLGTVPDNDTWVQWSGTADGVASGWHKATVRATDRTGYTQTPVRTATAPSGATGWHTVDFEVS